MKPRRVFFALPCNEKERVAVARWRDTHLQNLEARWVPKNNLHLTLAFIGNIKQSQLDHLLVQGDCIHGQAFRINLTRLGQWGQGKVIWLAPNNTPVELTELVRKLNRILTTMKLPSDSRPYRPHLTLARKAGVQNLPDVQPDLELTGDRFALFESILNGRNIRYVALKTWLL